MVKRLTALLTVLGLCGAGALLAEPAQGVLKAAEGRTVSVDDAANFAQRNLETGFQYWEHIPVVSQYAEIPDTEVRETILYERTPEKERLSHRVWDTYAFNGMSADQFMFERGYDEQGWRLIWVHPERSNENSTLTKLASEIDGKPVYACFTEEEDQSRGVRCPQDENETAHVTGIEREQVGTWRMPVGSKTTVDDVVGLAKEYFNLNLSGFTNDYESKSL